jgi:SAM-dependent methyltransferase
MPPRIIARQLSHPSGLLGRFVGHLMNRHNAAMNAFSVRQLDPKPSDRILEIGFGGGATLPSLIGATAFVAGVDRSVDAVEWAGARFSAAVADGRAEFRVGSVEALPFEAASFGKVCTVNTVYFWRSLGAGFAEIHRVLSPGGRVVVGFLPKERMDRMNFPADIFTSRAPEDVVAALAGSGFEQVRLERPDPKTKWNVIVATR